MAGLTTDYLVIAKSGKLRPNETKQRGQVHSGRNGSLKPRALPLGWVFPLSHLWTAQVSLLWVA